GEGREPRLVRGILRRSGGDAERDVEERDGPPLDGDQGEPGRFLRDLHRGQRDVADHARAPSGSSPGTSVTRLRRCEAKVARATRCTSSGFTVWDRPGSSREARQPPGLTSIWPRV